MKISKVICSLSIVAIVILVSGCLTGRSTGVIIIHEAYSAGEGDYVNLTTDELSQYPALKKVINDYVEFNINMSNVDDYDEWYRTSGFLGKKIQYVYLFSTDIKLEEQLNKGVATIELKNTFKSAGYSLPENFTIQYLDIGSEWSESTRYIQNRWWIEDENKNNLFHIWKEGDRLNVYQQRSVRIKYFKIGEKYYEINLVSED